jgi:hypothetical protein
MKFDNYEQFWLFYVGEHRNATSRTLHFCGTSLAAICLLLGIFSNAWLLLAAPVIGYAFAWTGHFVFEGNKPATFGHPLWSLRGDFRMYKLMLTGGIDDELEKSAKIYPPKK